MIPPIAAATNPMFDSLTTAVQGLESGEFSAVDLVADCLGRIEALDPVVKAWVSVDAAGATEAARQADARRAAGKTLSRLDGIPFGVKDIIDVAGWPTMAGFEPWRHRIATRDAAIVAELKRIGMIPIGKTVTTQFASIDPPLTRNPWDLFRTPGGSSSGSCAAVACRMVPLALGSQTGGSINRPASFCGVVGLKLPFGDWPVDGVVPCADRLDTLGPIVPAADDLRLILEAAFPLHNQKLRPANREPARPLRILRPGGRFRALAEPEMTNAVDLACRNLTTAGHQVDEIDQVPFFDDSVWETHRVVMMAGCYRTHREWFEHDPAAYAPKIRGWVEIGQALLRNDVETVTAAEEAQERLSRAFAHEFAGYDLLIVPAARGAASGPETTGDPVLNAPWTLLGVPSMTVPVSLSRAGLPLGVQLVNVRRTRAAVLEAIAAAGIVQHDPRTKSPDQP